MRERGKEIKHLSLSALPLSVAYSGKWKCYKKSNGVANGEWINGFGEWDDYFISEWVLC